jgi:hypothetical protein
VSRPYSLKRLLGFYLAELPWDIHGQAGGPAYRPFYKLRDMRALYNLRAADSGAWSGRRHNLAGNSEYKVFKSLEGNPYIVDIREQYPFCSQKVLEAALRDELASRNEIWTVDFLLTLPPFQRFGQLRYHGLSYKPENQKETAAGIRRAAREMKRLGEVGWSWSYVQMPSDIEVFNNEKLHGWCVRRGIDEVWAEASELASLFYRTTSQKTLRGQLDMFARRLRVPEEDQWFVFSAAYYFGFLQVNHKYMLKEDGPIFLKEPKHD